MNMFLLFALLSSAIVISNAVEIQVDNNGESSQGRDDSTEHPSALKVVITNMYEHDVQLYYIDSNDVSEHFMDTIFPGEQYNMNTFTGHSFLVKNVDDVDLSTVITVMNTFLHSILFHKHGARHHI